MRLDVTSEIGRLHSVLVHLPGREIDLMVPPMMAQLLFDDILYGQLAREEHRRFQQIIRFVAENVIEIQDLLEEVFDDPESRDLIIRDVSKTNKLSRKIVASLREMPAATLAEVMIGGIVIERRGSGQLPRFTLPPVPNFYFTRDPQVVIGDGVAISAMATEARQRESLLAHYVFRYHSAFRNDDILWLDRDDRAWPGSATAARRRPTLEGGDVIVASAELLIVGISERTNRRGVERLARSLRTSKSRVRTIIVVELPKQRSFMHLDTVFTFTSRNECLIYPPVLLPGGSEAAKVSTIDLRKPLIEYSSQKSLLAALKKQKFDLEPIFCGGSSAIDQQREQWTDGANAFALAPGIVLLYERNVRTAEELDRHGYHIVYEDDLLLGRTELETWTDKKYAIQIQGHELSRARGGPRCMTMPLERDTL